MKPTKKIRNRRGTTLAEVLIVIALMGILLGLAVPNIIGYAQMIKLAAMNDNARAVAVAVQSKLYAMQNSGTSSRSDYAMLNEGATDIPRDPAEKDDNHIKYVCSWDSSEDMLVAKQMLLSGAITDVDLLKNAYIVVVYDSDTADVLYVYYSDKPFDATRLFPTPSESYLKDNYIGQYIGEASPLPSYRAVLPNFSCEWVFDDEMYLQLTMIENPPAALLDKPLGLEVFAKIPKVVGTGKERPQDEWDEVLIYAEGFFATDYETSFAEEKTIKHDGNTLTLQKIADNGKHLRFALDSLVTYKAGYGNAYKYLRHNSEPEITSAAESLLYPREPVANWFNGIKNPYLTVFNREYANDSEIKISENLKNLIMNPSASVTEYVPINRSMSLHVKLHVLSDTKKQANDQNKGELYTFDDKTYSPVDVTSENMSPYFYALSNSDASVYISSMRDFGNLSYVFDDADSEITSARLVHDISGQQFNDKLVATRYALLKKINTVYGEEKMNEFIEKTWGYTDNHDTNEVDKMAIAGRKGTFTIDGKKPEQDGGGNYSISNVNGGGRATFPGGFFTYAENVTFSNIDIVNPRSWRNNVAKDFLKKEDGKLSGIDLRWTSVVSGALVGVAVNCTFENVHAYIDPENLLQIEKSDGGLQGDPGQENRLPQGLGDRRIEGTVVGGLVGVAIGDNDKPTSFTDCSASVLLTTGYLFAPSECIYSGGLVGIAFGNVTISESYAACSLNGYYCGGLVGVAANGQWSYSSDPNAQKENIESKTATGSLTIKNSFAAGHIDRLTRVGAGLIACVDYRSGSGNPSVSGCYSAVQWDALSPVAYGTFKDDNKNFYVSQTDLSLPITANVEAHFKVTGGDVIAKNNKSGIPCSKDQLKQALNKPLSPEGEWGTANSTSRWRYTEADFNKFPEAKEEETYPFPMLATNNKFWGDWINTGCYNTTGDINDNKQPKIEFDYYICLLYSYYLSWGDFLRHVNTGAVKSKEQWVRLYVEHDQALVNGNIVDSTTSYSYWANEAIKTKTTIKKLGELQLKIMEILSRYGQGIDGATTITLDEDKKNYNMYGAAFYDPDYDPIEGYSFKPQGDGIDLGMSQLNWDYYGFYCTPKFGANGIDTAKYYIQFDDENRAKDQDAYLDSDKDKHFVYDDGNKHYVYVDKEAFTKALKYTTFSLPTELKNLQLEWDKKEECFKVQSKKGA